MWESYILLGRTHNFCIYNIFISDDPTVVEVNLFVRSFSKIDDVKMVRIIYHPSQIETLEIPYPINNWQL